MAKQTSVILISFLLLLFFTSCASIVSDSKYPVIINTAPNGSQVSITDKQGEVVFKGNTPAVVKLQSGNGFWGKARYHVQLTKKGYDSKIITIDTSLDPWYWGNLVFGGPLGFLIIDPATGAMFKLDTKSISETMVKSSNQD